MSITKVVIAILCACVASLTITHVLSSIHVVLGLIAAFPVGYGCGWVAMSVALKD